MEEAEAKLLLRLKQADDILASYKAIALEVAKVLADMKSMYVFGVTGAYEGRLGCHETGDNVICLHITDAFRGESYKEYKMKAEKNAYDFDLEWFRKVNAFGITNLQISGYM